MDWSQQQVMRFGYGSGTAALSTQTDRSQSPYGGFEGGGGGAISGSSIDNAFVGSGATNSNNPYGLSDYDWYFFQRIRDIRTILPWFICAFGLAGNAAILFVFLQPARRKSSNAFCFVALALSDSAALLFMLLRSLLQQQVLGNVALACKLVRFVYHVSLQISSWCLVLLTVDRFVAVVLIFGYQSWSKRWHVAKLLGGMVLLVLLGNAHLLVFTESQDHQRSVPNGRGILPIAELSRLNTTRRHDGAANERTFDPRLLRTVDIRLPYDPKYWRQQQQQPRPNPEFFYPATMPPPIVIATTTAAVISVKLPRYTCFCDEQKHPIYYKYFFSKWDIYHAIAYGAVPFVLLLILNAIIIVRLVSTRGTKGKYKATSTTSTLAACKTSSNSKRSVSLRVDPTIKSIQITVMLLCVTFIFLLFTAPISLYMSVFYESLAGEVPQSKREYIKVVLRYIAYINNALNFYVYVALSSEFRREFVRRFTHICCFRPIRSSVTTCATSTTETATDDDGSNKRLPAMQLRPIDRRIKRMLELEDNKQKMPPIVEQDDSAEEPLFGAKQAPIPLARTQKYEARNVETWKPIVKKRTAINIKSNFNSVEQFKRDTVNQKLHYYPKDKSSSGFSNQREMLSNNMMSNNSKTTLPLKNTTPTFISADATYV